MPPLSARGPSIEAFQRGSIAISVARLRQLRLAAARDHFRFRAEASGAVAGTVDAPKRLRKARKPADQDLVLDEKAGASVPPPPPQHQHGREQQQKHPRQRRRRKAGAAGGHAAEKAEEALAPPQPTQQQNQRQQRRRHQRKVLAEPADQEAQVQGDERDSGVGAPRQPGSPGWEQHASGAGPGLPRLPAHDDQPNQQRGSGKPSELHRQRFRRAGEDSRSATKSGPQPWMQAAAPSNEQLEGAAPEAGRSAVEQHSAEGGGLPSKEALRLRLEQLQRERQRRRRGRRRGGALSPGQPTWTVEAAEALCGLGMQPEGAADALLAAHAYALQRMRAKQGPGTEAPAEGAEAEPADAGAEPAAAADDEGGEEVEAIGAERVEAVSRVLADTARVPVAALGGVLAAAPQLLACTPAEIRKQHDVVASVWRRPRRLAAAILEHPAMLGPGFPAELGRSLGELSSLGLSREQVSAAILRFPGITRLTRHEVVGHLRGAGLDLDKSTGEVLQFLSEHPHVMGREGAAALGERLAVFAAWRLPPPLCPLVLARCPLLLKEPVESMQAIADLLVGYSMTWRQLGEVVLGYPSLLRADPNAVRLTLKLLADFEIGLEEVVRYPRVFIHDPVLTLGPRLAYLKAYRPAKLRFRLVSILSRSDDEFASGFAARLEEEYAVFKDAWVRQYHEQAKLPPGRASPSRYWLEEVTEELWL